MGAFQKIACAFFFGMLFFFAHSSSTLAAACPVTDGGAGDGDATADGTITINANATWTPADATTWDCSGKAVLVTNNSTLTFASDTTNGYYGWLTADSLTIDSGSTISSNAYGCAPLKSGTYDGLAPSDLNVCTQGATGSGDGSSTTSNTRASGGGGYGGIGGNGVGGAAFNGAASLQHHTYQSPLFFGSSGGSHTTGTAGTGGGIVRLTISGTFTHNGLVSSNGSAASTGSAGVAPGGGSGGSVYVDVGVLAGTTGTFSATGGAGYVHSSSPTTYGGGGGGGRIAIYYTSKTMTLADATFSVVGGSNTGSSVTGGEGTVYEKNNTSAAVTSYAAFTLTASTAYSETTWTFDSGLTVNCLSTAAAPTISATTLTLGGTWACSGASLTSVGFSATSSFAITSGTTMSFTTTGADVDFNIPAGSSQTWTNFSFTGANEGLLTVNDVISLSLAGTTNIYANAQFTALTNLTVASTASIDADGLGCRSPAVSGTADGYAPDGSNVCTQGTTGGGGDGSTIASNTRAAGAAAHGGTGGAGVGGLAFNGAAQNITYDSATNPALFGASAGSINAGSGGAGGGYVRLIVSDTVSNQGRISADGNPYSGSTAGVAGAGGAGGTVYIDTITYTSTTGTLSAIGGDGRNTTVDGGGGGGRIAIFYITDTDGALAALVEATVAAGGVGGASNSGSTGSLYLDQDTTPGPVMTAAVTADTDNDGQIDAIVVTLDKDATAGSVSGADFTATSFTVASASRTASAQITIVLTESGSGDTGATPTVTIVGSITDTLGHTTTSGTQASTDGAVPVRLSQSYKDVVSVNGTVDRFDIVYSESLTLDECDSADYTLSGADVGSIALGSCAVSTTTLQLTVTGATANDTELTLTIAYTASAGTANSIHDAANNNAATYTAVSLADAAAPYALSASYKDVVLVNGTVDRVDVVFTETVTLSSYNASDWSFPGAGSLNLSDTGASASTATILVTVSSDTGETSSTSTPTVLYTNVSNRLKDASNNAVATFGSNLNVTDAAGPIIRSITIEDTGTPNGLIDKLTILWSENVDTDDGSAPVIGDLGTILLPDGQSVSSATISDPAGASASVVLTSVVGQVTPNTTAGSTAINGITTQWTDGTNATSNPDDSETVTDSAAPAALSASYKDVTSVDGTVDRVDILFSEALTLSSYNASDWAMTETSTMNLADTNATVSTTTLRLAVSADSYETGAAIDPTVTYTNNAGRLTDGTNAVATFGSALTVTDGALGFLRTDSTNAPTYLDTAVVDGRIDRLRLNFTEAVTISYVDGDWTAVANGLTSFDTGAYSSGSGTTQILLTATAAVNLTGVSGGTEPTIAFSGASGYIRDAGSNAITISTTNLVDGAAAIAANIAYRDANGDAQVDRIDVTFTEQPVVGDCAPTDYTVGGGDAGSIVVATAGCAVSGSDLQLTVTGAPASTTALTITLTYNAANGTANSLKDATAIAIASFGPTDIADGTDPARVSQRYVDSNADGTVDRFDITFSEPVTVDECESGDFSIGGADVGSFAVASCATSGNDVRITVTGGAADTSLTLTLAYTQAAGVANSLHDATGNNVTNLAATSLTDAAAPILISQSYKDIVSVNGTVDRFDLVFSENITLDECDAADYTFGGASVGSIALGSCATSTTTLQLTVTGASANTTNLTLTVAYTAAGGTANSINDGTNNTGNISAATLADAAAPIAISASYKDTDVNGTVDRVDILFSEAMTLSSYSGGDWSFPGTGSLNLSDSNAAASSSTIQVSVSSDTGETSSTSTPTVLYTNVGNRLKDGSNNFVITFGSNLNVTDAAAPVIRTVTIEDTGAANGIIDKVTILWSENVDTDDGAAPVIGDFGTLALPDGQSASSATISDPAGASATVILTSVVGQITPNTAAGSTAINGITTHWTDGTNVTSNPDDAETITDSAAPFLRTDGTNAVRYEDSNGDATIDRVKLVFSEAATISYTDSDWTATANGLTSFDVSTVASGNGTATIYLTGSAASNITGVGAGTQPTIAFTAGTGSIVDASASANALASISSRSLADAATPLLLSNTPASGATSVAIDASVILNFSEPIVTGTAAYTFSSTPTGLSDAWSVSDTRLTVSHSGTFTPSATITFTMTVAADATGNAFGGADSGATHPFSFTITADGAPPVLQSGVTGDDDTDGHIDRVVLTFNEDVSGATVTGVDFTVTGYTVSSASRTSSATVTIVLTELVSYDTSATPSTSLVGSVDDLSANSATSGTITPTDGATPISISASYKDTDVNGTVDRVDILFSEAMTLTSYSAGDWSFPGTGSLNISDSSATASSTTIQVSVSSDTGETSSTSTPTVLYTNAGNRLKDASNNAVATFGSNLNVTDAAAPAIRSMTFEDTGTANGLIDKLTIVWSEVLDTDDGAAPVIGDFGTITLPDGQTVSSATISDPAGASATVILTSVVGQVTPNTAAGSTGINGITTHWTDGTNTTSNPDDAETITDSAAPFLRTDGTNAVRYEDSNGDATIDRVKLVFSEATTISYTDSDWTATANGLTSFDVSTVGSGNGTATIYLTGSAASNLTGVGAGTQPTIAFTAGTGSIVDGSTNALTSISSRSLADAAAPLLLSSTPTSGATDVAVDASVILNFSEPIVTGTAAYTFSSAPTGLSDVWSVSDTRLTVSHSGSYTTGATITFTMTVAADASGNAFGGGDSGVTHPVVFTIVSITNPTLVSATTADNDADGYLDRILVVFSEDITSGSVAGGDFTVTGYTVSSASRSASATVTIVFAEGGTADTSATPQVTVVGSVSGADDGTITSGSVTPTDAVAPVLVSQSYKDIVSVNGVVDRFDLVFSESITLDECDLADYTIGGADVGSLAVASCAVSTTTLQITVSNAPINDTNLALTIAYAAASGTANSIHDGGNNNTGNISAATLADVAAPIAISASYKDTDVNGTVDRVDILFSEAMTLTTYSADDWSFPGTGSLNLSDSSAAASSSTIHVSVSSDTGETSSTSTPTVLYTNAANRLTDAASNAVATFGAAVNVTDAAAPAIRSMTFEDTGTANGLIDKLTILWSEVLDTDDGSAPVIGDFGTITLPDGQTVSSATISDPAGASASVVLTNVVGQVTANTAAGSTGINGISTYWTDGTNTTSNPDDAETITDSAAPVALSGLYQDIVSADGQVDKIVITFSEATTVAGCEVGDYSFGGSNGTGVEILNCTGTGTTTLSFELTGTPTANTAPSLTWNYSASAGVASSLRDATNAVANVSSLALADDADPRLITTLANGPRYQDADTNGTVDRVRLIFTEAVTFTYADADFSATPNSLTSFDVSGITSGNGSSTVYLTATALANLTGVGSATEPALAFTPLTGFILDASSNPLAAFTATTLRDGAAPIARYATARDIDSNGTADRIDVTMTEAAALDECEAGDYAWSGTDGGSVAVTACAASGNDMRLTISGAPSNDTLFTASMTYTQNAGVAASLDDGASNAVSDFTFSSFTDAIAPIIVTISPADGATSVTNTQNIIVTFSEPMNTGVYAHTLSPSVSSQVSTWNDAHTQVTTTHATFITGAYTFTVTSAEDTSANAFAGASAVTHPVTFTVILRHPSTIITPVVPVPNIDSFTITDASLGSALKYLVPGSAIQFAWTYTGGDAWFALDVSYDAGKTSTRIIDPAKTFNARTTTWTVPRSASSATFTLSAMYNETKLTSKTSSRYTTAELAEEEAAAEENTADSASTAPESVIRVEGSDAVYAIVNGTRRVFINSAAYFTWYDHFDDVVTVSAETLAEYPIAGLMLPKAETVLVKIQSVPYVYFLGSNSDNAFSPLLRWITSEEIAISLFGTRWADYVIDIAPTFFTKFTQGEAIDSVDDVEGDASTMVTRESLAAR